MHYVLSPVCLETVLLAYVIQDEVKMSDICAASSVHESLYRSLFLMVCLISSHFVHCVAKVCLYSDKQVLTYRAGLCKAVYVAN